MHSPPPPAPPAEWLCFDSEEKKSTHPQPRERAMDAEDATQPTQAPPEVPDISEPQPVIMIKAMELINFKSYANTVMLGPFDRHMTSVVGPNGSGKSNVIDAMLFVFGFKAKQCAAHRAAAPLPPLHSRAHRPPTPREKETHGRCAVRRVVFVFAGCARARCPS